MRQFRRQTVGAVTAVLAAGAALAQGEPIDPFELSLEELSAVEVETASRTPESRWRAPGTVYTFSRADLEARGYRHLGELLRDLPGVDSHAYSSGVFYNRFAVRGISGNNKFIILQDGSRIGAPAGEPLAIADNFPLQHVGRVEIVMGPASALYGADAVTGVVQLFSDTADGRLAVEAGQDALRRLAVRTGTPGGRGWRFAFHAQNHDHDDLAAAYRQDFPWQDLVTFGGETVQTAATRHAYDAETRSRYALLEYAGEGWRAGATHQRFRHPSTAGDLPSVVDYGAFLAYELNEVHATRNWATAAGGDFAVQLQYRDYRMDTASSFRNIFTDFRHGYEYAESRQTRFEAVLQQPWGQHRLVAGLEASHTEAIPKTADLIAPFDHGRSPHDQGFYFGAPNDILTRLFPVDYEDYALFVQDSISLGERWDLGLGARYGHNSTYDDILTPRLNLNWRLSETQRLNLLYGEAYLAPSPQFTWEHFGSIVAGNARDGYFSPFMFLPNPSLEPEQSRTLELNYAAVHGSGEWQLSLWRSRLDDLILPEFDPRPNTDFLPNTRIASTQRNANVGRLNAHGLDLWWRTRLSSTLELWAAYSYTDGEVAVEGYARDSALPYVARHKAKLGASWQLSEAWLLSPSVLASGKAQPLRSLSEQQTPGYAVVNLFASYRLAPTVQLELRVHNLFDRRWYSVGDATLPTFVRSPQETRSASLGLIWRF